LTHAQRTYDQFGQSIWYDNIQRAQLQSGKFASLVADGVRGCTSNPTIFHKAIGSTSDYDAALAKLAAQGASVDDAYYALVGDDIRNGADVLRQVYDASGKRDGYISVEVQPRLSSNATETVREARKLIELVDRPNVMIKVPATPEGLPAVTALIGEGISVNVTLIFAIESYRAVAGAYIDGLERAAAAGKELSAIASVASFFVSRVDSSVDGLLDAAIAQRPGDAEALRGLRGKAAIANAKLAYAAYQEIFSADRFASLAQRGAQPQRVLWASTGTKNPSYSDTLYVDELIGKDTVNTVPPATLDAFQDHGAVAGTLDRGLDDARSTFAQLAAAGIDMDRVCADLLAQGVQAFIDSMDALMEVIAKKKSPQ